MSSMFESASAFDQNIGRWDVTALTDATDMFKDNWLSTPTYDALLNGWDAQILHSGVTFDGGISGYCAGEAARTNMITADTWTITDGGKDCTQPEIEVTGNGVPIPNGDSFSSPSDDTAFASMTVGGTPITHTFTISNVGYTDLYLTGTPTVVLSTGTHFNVTQQPGSTTVVSGTAVTFQITFDPLSNSTKFDTVTIENNDSNESNYAFKISGYGTVLTDDFVVTVQTDNA